jgi:nucleotide-binding universal stress UspA family protein
MSILTKANPSAETRDACACDWAQSAAPSAQPKPIRNILVGIDFSEYSAAALRYATYLAESFGAKLTLAHAAESYVYPEDLAAGLTVADVDARWEKNQAEKLENLRNSVKKEISTGVVITRGPAWSQIVVMSKSTGADLIILGTHGRTGLKHALMGSTAERVVRHATCPVLVVHLPAEAGR